MQKQFVKRSTFQVVSLTDGNIKTVLVEGDEAYITVMNSNGNSCYVRRQYERDLKKALVASTLTGGSFSLTEWMTLDFLFGRVSLDSPTTDGTLQNTQITTAVGQTRIQERQRNHNVGMKEFVDLLASGTQFPLNICIESVNYVPADLIAA